MITEPVTISLTEHQLALFQSLEREKREFLAALQQSLNVAITAIVGVQYGLADLKGCQFNVTDTGIIITPASVERTLELSG